MKDSSFSLQGKSRTTSYVLLTCGVFLLAACGAGNDNKKRALSNQTENLAFIRPAPLKVKSNIFSEPSAVTYDPEADIYLVSNVAGESLKKDDNGFISRVSPTGEIIDARWIDGATAQVRLNAPKGMAVFGKRIYVADIDTVRIFDRKSGKARGNVKIPKATSLSGVSAAPNGTIYITDRGLKLHEDKVLASEQDAVHTISKWGKWRRLNRGPELSQPSAISADDRGAWVTSGSSGTMYRISKRGKREEPMALPGDGFDGVVRLADGNILASSSTNDRVVVGRPGGAFRTAVEGVRRPAGIGYDTVRKRVLVTLPSSNTVLIQQLSGWEETGDAL